MSRGQHILLSLLSEYSQSKTSPDGIDDVSDRLNAGLLLHGSSSNTMWKTVDELRWVSARNEEEKETKRQGLGLKQPNLLISDMFDLMTQSPNIPDALKAEYPELTDEAYQAGIQTIWLLLRALEWSHGADNQDDEGDVEKDKLLARYVRKLREYEANPDDYS